MVCCRRKLNRTHNLRAAFTLTSFLTSNECVASLSLFFCSSLSLNYVSFAHFYSICEVIYFRFHSDRPSQHILIMYPLLHCVRIGNGRHNVWAWVCIWLYLFVCAWKWKVTFDSCRHKWRLKMRKRRNHSVQVQIHLFVCKGNVRQHGTFALAVIFLWFHLV